MGGLKPYLPNDHPTTLAHLTDLYVHHDGCAGGKWVFQRWQNMFGPLGLVQSHVKQFGSTTGDYRQETSMR
jgi:hypothetical protein